MSTELDVIALARAAGLCVADCHFLDLDPYEDLVETMAQYDTEAERDTYLAAVRREDQRGAGTNQQVASGGSCTTADQSHPCQGSATAWTAPALPTFDPP